MSMRNKVRTLNLVDAAKAQDTAAYCYMRAQELRPDGKARSMLMRDAEYWSARARSFLFQTIGDGLCEDEWFESSLGHYS